MSERVLVLRTVHMEDVVAFLTGMGLDFLPEKHGDGPEHYACQVGDRVLEVYPGGPEGRVRFYDSEAGPKRVWDDKLKQYVYPTDTP